MHFNFLEHIWNQFEDESDCVGIGMPPSSLLCGLLIPPPNHSIRLPDIIIITIFISTDRLAASHLFLVPASFAVVVPLVLLPPLCSALFIILV